MSFSVGDKVKVTEPSHGMYGENGTVTWTHEEAKAYLVKFASGKEHGLFENELELLDEKAEAVIELAETLEKARQMATAIPGLVLQGGAYGRISTALMNTMEEYFASKGLSRSHGYKAYESMLLNGLTVREAIKEVGK